MTRVRIREKKQDECNTAPTYNTIVESAIKNKVVKYFINTNSNTANVSKTVQLSSTFPFAPLSFLYE